MNASNIGLIILLVLILIIIVYKYYMNKKDQQPAKQYIVSSNQNGIRHCGDSDGKYNPYLVLNQQLDSLRGIRRNDGYNQTMSLRELGYGKFGMGRYNHAGAYVTPEQMAEAEREQWYATSNMDNCATFNSELTNDMSADTTQYHTSQPAINYDKYIVDLVADTRVKANHDKWLEEMQPWTGTTMKVDNLDIEPYISFTGLRRPQAVVQYNPMQITEADTWDLSGNPKFNFRG
jgi:hypothetical protein